MHRGGRLAVVFALLEAFSIQTGAAEIDVGKKVLRAGAYAVDITPEYFPVSSNGGMSDQQATVAHDSLHARRLLLHNGETSLAIVVCDDCAIPRDIIDAAKSP